MDTKIFKAFTPIINLGTSKTPIQRIFENLETREADDPSGGSWRHMGFIRPIEGDDFIVAMDGAGWLACVQINERNLPGAVIREKVVEKMRATEGISGRKPGKKEMAQIRDDVEMELLPMAFIKRKLVPIMFVGKKVFVFSSSAKVVDDVLSLLVSVAEMDDMFAPYRLALMVENNIDAELTMLARDGQSMTVDSEGESKINYLSIGNMAMLRGPDKQKITVNDKDIASDDVSQLLESEAYTVAKLGLEHFLVGETEADSSFIMTDMLVFSRFVADGVTNVRGKSKTDAADTLLGTAWLVAKAIDSAVDTVISVMGGLRVTAKPKEDEKITMTKSAAAEPDDDEL